MSNKILVTLSRFAKDDIAPQKLLEESGFNFQINETGKRFNQEQLIKHASGFMGIVAGLEEYNADVLAALPDLKCISRCGVGIDSIDQDAAKVHNVHICNTPDVVIQPVAELTVGLAFDLLRKISEQHSLMKDKKWQRITGSNLKGKVVGILGLGRIGRRTAELFSALGAIVVGADLYPDHEWANKHQVKVCPIDELLSNSAIISIHLTHVSKHRFYLTKDHFKLMKPSAMLINVARASFVNENDLIEALKNKIIAGAAVDVYEQEPYDGLLCGCENIILTPHIATQTIESRVEMECQAVNNLIQFLNEGR